MVWGEEFDLKKLNHLEKALEKPTGGVNKEFMVQQNFLAKDV